MALQIQKSFLKDQPVVWVTGASSGIGAEFARQLAQQGARLILSARREPNLQTLRATLPSPESHLILPLDMSDISSFDEAMTLALKAFPKIDVLINNAGISHRDWAADTSLSVDRQVMEVNYFGPVALSKRLVRLWKNTNGGVLVFISSMTGKLGSQKRSAYSAAKHALLGFAESIRPEVYENNIAVVSVCPSFVRTNISQNALTAKGQTYDKADSEIENGMPVEDFVRTVIKRILRGDEEVVLARGMPFWGYLLKRFSANAYHKAVRRFYRRKEQT